MSKDIGLYHLTRHSHSWGHKNGINSDIFLSELRKNISRRTAHEADVLR